MLKFKIIFLPIPFFYLTISSAEIPFFDQNSSTSACHVSPFSDLERQIQTLGESVPTREKCPLLESYEGYEMAGAYQGKLSPNWAREYTGADFARALVREEEGLAPASVAVFDQYFNQGTMRLHEDAPFYLHSERANPHLGYHGSNVASVIADSPAAFAEKTEWAWIAQIRSSPADYEEHQIMMAGNGVVPKLINNSAVWDDDIPCRVFTGFAEKGSIVVKGAGNDFPVASEDGPTLETRSSRGTNHCPAVITAGSLSPEGFASVFSSEPKEGELNILAPSDTSLLLAAGNAKGEMNGFGGTSGASPAVMASLANAVNFLPDLTPQQAKTLLERTATPNPNAWVPPGRNGPGMLNAYKLAKVAKKIRDQCQGSADFSICQERAIQDPKSYRFFTSMNEKFSITHGMSSAFPQCVFDRDSTSEVRSTASCEAKKEMLDRLRKAVLLNPDYSSGWKWLSCIHRDLGHEVNADFYQRMGRERTVESLEDEILSLIQSEDRDRKLLGLRNVNALPPETAVKILSAALTDKDTRVREMVMKSAVGLGKSGVGILGAGLEDVAYSVRIQSIRSASLLNEDGVDYLLSIMDHPRSQLRQTAISSACTIGEAARPIFEKALEDSNADIQNEGKVCLFKIDGAN
jgi:hypothetical protein